MVFLKISQNLQENACARVSFLIKLQGSACSLIKNETSGQVFSCEFCETFKNTFFHRTSPITPVNYFNFILNVFELNLSFNQASCVSAFAYIIISKSTEAFTSGTVKKMMQFYRYVGIIFK